MAATTIDQATKVNIGILGTILAAVIGGTVYMSTLHVTVSHIADTLNEVKTAINQTNSQMTSDSKTLAIMQALVQSIERRVVLLEKEKSR